jgi:hypothetical protein
MSALTTFESGKERLEDMLRHQERGKRNFQNSNGTSLGRRTHS